MEYMQSWIDHCARPRHFSQPPDESLPSAEGHKPSCGDHVKIWLDTRDGIVHTGWYQGESCAICRASADMAIDNLQGMTVEQAADSCEAFLAYMEADGDVPDLMEVGDCYEFHCLLRQMPSRVKCATLPWTAIQKILQDKCGKSGDSGQNS